MAWSSPGGGQQSAWHASPDSFAGIPVAVRQRPGDNQVYAYSWASYTNNGDYPMPVHPPIAPLRRHQEPEWLQDSHRENEACEARHSQHAMYPPHPAQLPPPRLHAARTTIGAAHLPVHIIDTEEEAARQAMSAAAPPPARPARSTARAQRPPIPPPSTCPRVDTRSDDARMEVHARDATWQERLPARPPPPPTRPPPRPARAAARQPTRPTRHEHPSKEPAYAMSAHATSLGSAGRTMPTNDRHVLSSTSTATATSTRPFPSTAVSTRSQTLPSLPLRPSGPRAPPANITDHRPTTNSSDILQDVAYLRAIDEYVQEGGEKREKAREDEGEDAPARSVRGTHSSVLHTADRDISRVSPSPRAPGTPAKAISRATDTATRDELDSALPAVRHLIRMDERLRAPSAQVSTASRVTTRGQDGHTTTTIPCRPPRSFVVPPPLPPPPPHHDRDARGETRKSKSSREMAVPTSRETATRKKERDRATTAPDPSSSILKPPPTLRAPPMRPAFSPAPRPFPTPVNVHVPPPRPPQSIARRLDSMRTLRAGMIEPPAISSFPSHKINIPSASHHHDAFKVTRGGREGEGGRRSRPADPSDGDGAPAHRIPQYHGTREGGPRIDPATSMPPLPFPPRLRPALSKHPTPTPRPIRLQAPLQPTQLTTRDGSTSEQSAQIEVSAISSTGMHDRTDPRVSIPLALAMARTHSVAMAQDVAGTHTEYTSVDDVHLARAPATVHPARRAVGDHVRRGGGRSHQAVSDFASGGARLGVTQLGAHSPPFVATPGYSYEHPRPHAPPPLASSTHSPSPHNVSPTQRTLIHATKHPPASNFASSPSRSRYLSPPPPSPPMPSWQSPPRPPGWPFPMSVQELGWVLAAVVLARNMDREDERSRREYEDDDYLSFSTLDSDDHERSASGDGLPPRSESDSDLAGHAQYSESCPDDSLPTLDSDLDSTSLNEEHVEMVAEGYEYAGTVDNPPSPVLSLATDVSNFDHESSDYEGLDGAEEQEDY